MSIRWGLLWRSKNKLDGITEHIIWRNCEPLLFKTRALARFANKQMHGYIKDRDDLKCEPHGWKMPQVVKVNLRVDLAE